MWPFRPAARVAAALLASFLAVVFAGRAAAIAASIPDPVRIATEGAHPPFNYVENGEPAGFEVDLGKALCRQAKLTCIFVIHQWDGIIKALEAREYDAIMSSLAMTEKRRARIAFTRVYYRIPLSVLVAKDSPLQGLGPDTFRGRRVGAVDGTPAAAYLEVRHPDAIVRPFGGAVEAGLDLAMGRLDLVVADKLALTTFLDTPEGKDCCRLLGDIPAGDPLLGEGIGIGVRRDDTALRDALDGALAALMADGTYDRIRETYIPFDTK